MEISSVSVTRILLLISVLLGAVLSDTITTEPQIFEVHVGDDVSLPCRAEGVAFDLFTWSFNWEKETQNGNTDVTNGALISDDFLPTGRFSLNFEIQGDHFELNITGVELVDNGTYSCVLKQRSNKLSTVQHHIIVIAPPEDVIMETNETRPAVNWTRFVFDELQPSYLACKVIGGNPEPSVKMIRGITDITEEFIRTSRLVYEQQGPFEIAKYHVELIAPSFRATYEHAGRNLKCAARIPGHEDLKEEHLVGMYVKYAPKFTVCEEVITIRHDAEDLVIHCHVSANPHLNYNTIQFEFASGNDTVVLTHGQQENGIYANITRNMNGSVEAYLTIGQVIATGLNKVTLRAENSIASVHHDMYFEEEQITTKPTSTLRYVVRKEEEDENEKEQEVVEVGGDAQVTESTEGQEQEEQEEQGEQEKENGEEQEEGGEEEGGQQGEVKPENAATSVSLSFFLLSHMSLFCTLFCLLH